MKSAINKIKQQLNNIDSTSAKIFLLGLLVLEICVIISAILAVLTNFAADGEYYTLMELKNVIFSTGSRIFSLGVILCFVSDLVFRMQT